MRTGEMSGLAASFDAMWTSLHAQATQAQHIVNLAQPELLASDPNLQHFTASLAQLEQLVRDSSALLDQEEAALAQIRGDVLPALRGLRSELKEQQATLDETLARAPPAQPQPHDVEERVPLASKSLNGKADPPRSAKKKGSTKDTASSSGSTKKSGHLPTDGIRMAHVTDAEFETIPKYMRGRLELARLNGAVDAWVDLLREKYGILNAKGGMKALSEAQMRRFQQWADEETDETANAYFLSTEDLRGSAELQGLGSTNLKAVLVGLRHVGRVKTMAGAGMPKYILL